MLNNIKRNRITWRDIYIHGKKSQYRVSSSGDVKDRFTGKSMNMYSNADGSLSVLLECDDKIHKLRIHQLVAKAFIINPDGYRCVCHKDGCRHNNLVTNLEWDINRG